MITEDYVSFEVAKLLKEKGFNAKCFDFYEVEYEEPKHKHTQRYTPVDWNGEEDENCYSCPTHQMAMKWLREVHNLCIEPYRTACGYLYTISTIPYGSCKCNPAEGGDDEDSGQWTSYEGACEAALKYCLKNLI